MRDSAKRNAFLTLAVAGLLLWLGARGGQAAQELYLYDGDTAGAWGNITLGSWGSGKAEETYDQHYMGPKVLKVTSHGFYQGLILRFGEPVDWGNFLKDPNGYIVVYIRPSLAPPPPKEESQTQTQTQGFQAGGGQRGGLGSRGTGTRGSRTTTRTTQRSTRQTTGTTGTSGRGGFAGRGAPQAGLGGVGQPGQTTTGTEPKGPALRLRNIRFIAETEAGLMVAEPVPLFPGTQDRNGWTEVAFPLSGFKGGQPGAQLKALRLFADRYDVFYLGRIKLMVDDTPFSASAEVEPLNPKAERILRFRATVVSGAATPEVSWDFDASDGIETQAVGTTVNWLYKKPGKYTITYTVSDKTGTKKPLTHTLDIIVGRAPVVRQSSSY